MGSEASNRKEGWARFFRKSGYRFTKQREEILGYLESEKGAHPSAQQIMRHLLEEEHKVSIATVYNTLNFLVRMGIIKVIEFDSSENRYELNMEPHINLICKSCGEIEDIPQVVAIPAWKDQSYKILDSRLELYVVCRSCMSKEGSGEHLLSSPPSLKPIENLQ